MEFFSFTEQTVEESPVSNPPKTRLTSAKIWLNLSSGNVVRQLRDRCCVQI